MSEQSSRENPEENAAEHATLKRDNPGSKQDSFPSSEPELRSRSDSYKAHSKPVENDCYHTSEHGVITIETESIHSSDTELSTYVTCCSECERSEDLNHTDEVHDRNNNKNARTTSIGERSTGGRDSCRSTRSGGTRQPNDDDKIYEAMNYQVLTSPKSNKLESEEMKIKITETKENVKAITTIHLIHTPEPRGTSEVEGNVSRKKRLFTQAKKPTDHKYRRLFYELPETSSETHFAEEEFVYEPRFRTTTTKLVMKARSLINLTDDNADADIKRPEMKSADFTKNLQRHHSEPDLDTIRRPRSEEKLDKIGDDTRFQCIKKHLESSIYKTNMNRVKSELVSTLNRVKDENMNTLNVDAVKKTEAGNESRDEKNMSTLPKSKGTDEQSKHAECWITGATFKNPPEVKTENFQWNTCPRRDRFCFYYPKKRNREIIDDELPDPDKVKDIRNKFEQTIQTRTTENINQTRTNPKKTPAGNRSNKHQFNTWSPAYHTYPTVEIAETNRTLKKDYQAKLSDSPKFKYWSDTTSVSSGVASDFSCETDSESSPKIEPLDLFHTSSVDDSGQPVSVDTLKKIRACGTSTTYYGGRMISCDKGTVRSPMTMTIMDEIRQNIKENEVNLQLGIKSLQNKYSGMKFRLVKSNSCGSRLELTGTNSRDRYKRQNQVLPQENRPKKLESVNENDSGNPAQDSGNCKYSTVLNLFPEKPTVTRVDLKTIRGCNSILGNCGPTCELPSKKETCSEFTSSKEQNSKNNDDYNSICLIEADELQNGIEANHKDFPDFVWTNGQSTKDIVKVFESANSQTEGTPSVPWKTLVESRKQANRMAGVKSIPVFDEMEFEEFEVLDESAQNQNMTQNNSPLIIEANS